MLVMQRLNLYLKQERSVPPQGYWTETWSSSRLLSSPVRTHTSAHYCTPTERKFIKHQQVCVIDEYAVCRVRWVAGGLCRRSVAYSVSGADGLGGGARTGAEVELFNRQTLVIQTDAVCSAGRPVLDVPQVCVSVNQHMRTAEWGTSQREAVCLGELCLCVASGFNGK